MGYISMAMGGGLAFGPVITSLLMRFLNYDQVFYVFGLYLFVLGLPVIYMVPARCNFSKTPEEVKKE